MADDELFPRGSRPERTRIADILRKETIGGLLLVAGAVVAIAWANSPWGDAYATLRDTTIGPSAWHLDLTIGEWASDGLLAIFFFVVGLELKREFVAGDLRDPRRAALPVIAALAGMAVPALIYVGINVVGPNGALEGWAIPTATDIAFAVAVLAVISTHLPTGLRTFLLTLAVADDLFAITIIALFYTSDLNLLALVLTFVPVAIFGLLVQMRIRTWWLLIPIALVAWVLMHESGVHATISGVLLGFSVPVLRSEKHGGPNAGHGMAEHLEHRIRPISAGIAVPVFAFFAAGVNVGGFSGLAKSLTDTVALGILFGLLVGKTFGIFGSTYLMAKFTRADLDKDLAWIDVVGVSALAGIGFTVSLLIGELAFGAGSVRDEHVKVGVLLGSLSSAIIGSVILRSRNRVYRRIEERETVDDDHNRPTDTFDRDDE